MAFDALGSLLLSKRDADALFAFYPENKTWEDFCIDVSELRQYLHQQKEARWAIFCNDSYFFAVALFAASYANKALILPSNHQSESIKYLAENYFDGMLIDNTSLMQTNSNVCMLPFIKNKNKSAQTTELIGDKLNLQQVKLTIFTSGTSGLPKAVDKTLAYLGYEINALQKQWGELLLGAHIVSTVRHHHIYGLLFRVLWPICAGLPISRNELLYPEQVIKNARANNVLISSPALLKRLTDGVLTQGYRAVFSSGGPLSFDAAFSSSKYIKSVPIEVFGSTETGGIGFRQQKTAHATWQFFSELQVQLGIDECLAVKSPWIPLEGFYQTSDQCDLLNDGQFMLKGRIDNIIKIEEKRVSLREIEKSLMRLVWVNTAKVIAINTQQCNYLGAILKLSLQGEKKLQTVGKGKFWILLRQKLRLWIEPVAIPRHYRTVVEFPMNTQGKCLYRDLVRLFKGTNT